MYASHLTTREVSMKCAFVELLPPHKHCKLHNRECMENVRIARSTLGIVFATIDCVYIGAIVCAFEVPARNVQCVC